MLCVENCLHDYDTGSKSAVEKVRWSLLVFLCAFAIMTDSVCNFEAAVLAAEFDNPQSLSKLACRLKLYRNAAYACTAPSLQFYKLFVTADV